MQRPPGILAGRTGEHSGTPVPGRSTKSSGGQAHWFKHSPLSQHFLPTWPGRWSAGPSLYYSVVKELTRYVEQRWRTNKSHPHSRARQRFKGWLLPFSIYLWYLVTSGPKDSFKVYRGRNRGRAVRTGWYWGKIFCLLGLRWKDWVIGYFC